MSSSASGIFQLTSEHSIGSISTTTVNAPFPHPAVQVEVILASSHSVPSHCNCTLYMILALAHALPPPPALALSTTAGAVAPGKYRYLSLSLPVFHPPSSLFVQSLPAHNILYSQRSFIFAEASLSLKHTSVSLDLKSAAITTLWLPHFSYTLQSPHSFNSPIPTLSSNFISEDVSQVCCPSIPSPATDKITNLIV